MQTDDVKVTLKPCPFCGCQLEEWGGDAWHHPGAVDCPLDDLVFEDRDMDDWNTRHTAESDQTTPADGLADDRPDIPGDPIAKIASYNDCHEEALRMGYPSMTEALEHLHELRTQPDASAREDAMADLAACERAIERMGWDEIRAFEAQPGQSPHEDGGGFKLRRIKALFGIKPDRLETYREAARRLVAEAEAQGGGSMQEQYNRLINNPTGGESHEG
jgi:hypothetical protein|tara:strand:- start:45042 stop:45695 length:654 start_codon:yes stop_codon:yes gene_type:complete